jgi:hypothetical protein
LQSCSKSSIFTHFAVVAKVILIINTMNPIVSMVLSQVTAPVVRQISEKLGISPNIAQAVVTMAAPMLVSALSRNAADPQGAEALAGAVDKDHDGSILNDLMGLVSNPAAGNGMGILGHILGAKQAPAQQVIGAQTGADAGTVGNIMEMLAPVVMGVLGQQKQQQGLDAGGLAGLLGGTQAQSDDMLGGLAGMLDMNNDGNSMDDIMKLVGGFMGGQK